MTIYAVYSYVSCARGTLESSKQTVCLAHAMRNKEIHDDDKMGIETIKNACILCMLWQFCGDQFDLAGINIGTKNRRIASQSVEMKIKLKIRIQWNERPSYNVIDDCW